LISIFGCSVNSKEKKSPEQPPPVSAAAAAAAGGYQAADNGYYSTSEPNDYANPTYEYASPPLTHDEHEYSLPDNIIYLTDPSLGESSVS